MSDNKKESRFLRNIHPLLKRGRRTDKPGNDSNFALLTAIDESLKDVEGEALNAKLYTSLSTAPGEYLDLYGRYFGVKRKEGERDDPYRKRIIEKIDIPRGTNHALEFATRRYLGNPNLQMNIHEYWREVFRLNHSLLNGHDHLLGDIYNVAVIDIRIGSPFPVGLVEELNKFKPAGVTMYLTYDPSLSSGEKPGSRVVPYMEYSLEHSTLAMSEKGLNKFYIGSLRLSDQVVRTDDGLFILNVSKLNSLDRLGGNYRIINDNVNQLGVGFNTIQPKKNDWLEDIYAQQRHLNASTYSELDTFGSGSIKVDIQPAQSLYFNYDVEQHSSTKYGRVDYTLLDNAEFVINTKESRDRVQYTIEVFNFKKDKWESKYLGYSKKEFSVKAIQIGQAEDYINSNGVLTFRITPMARVEFELDYASLDYRYEVDYITSNNYGYVAKNSTQSIKYPPVITNYLLNGLNTSVQGEIKLSDQIASIGKDKFILNISELNSGDVLDNSYDFDLTNYGYLSNLGYYSIYGKVDEGVGVDEFSELLMNNLTNSEKDYIISEGDAPYVRIHKSPATEYGYVYQPEGEVLDSYTSWSKDERLREPLVEDIASQLLSNLELDESFIEDIYGLHTIIPENTYQALDDPQSGGTIEILTSQDIGAYFSFDIISYLKAKYSDVISPKELYHVLNGAIFNLNSKEDREDVPCRLEIYNYSDGHWESQTEGVTALDFTDKTFTLSESSNYINKNGLLIIRLSTDGDILSTLNSLAITYDYEIGKLLDFNYGFCAKSSSQTIT